MKLLLIIDDESSHRQMIRVITEDDGWLVEEASCGEEGLAILKKIRPDAVLLDMRMPGLSGIETLVKGLKIYHSLPIIMLTAYGTVDAAVEAMKLGAFDYLTKPTDNDELLAILNKAYKYSKLLLENESLKHKLQNSGTKINTALSQIVGNSQPIKKVVELIKQVGPSEATVLILGESGTGKELIAEAIHEAGIRSFGPLIKVNCAALPSELLESELFGYSKGAFTGAVKDKLGRFQLAKGGTLFLDEIGDLPFFLQAKILRALQEKMVEPLGSITNIPVDVRIIAATNKNLKLAMQQGLFREDLFFRLNVLEIVSPPLRERLEDLPLLVSHLLVRLSEKNKFKINSVSPAFLEALLKYSWPGNIRELENILERAIILSRSEVLTVDTLPVVVLESNDVGQDEPLDLTQAKSKQLEDMLFDNYDNQQMIFSENKGFVDSKVTVINSLFEKSEKDALEKALQIFQGHREKTAEALGVSRRTLQYKLKKYGLITRR